MGGGGEGLIGGLTCMITFFPKKSQKIFKKNDTIKKSYKDMEQQALKGVHENETLISHHPSCKSSWYTLIRDTAVQ